MWLQLQKTHTHTLTCVWKSSNLSAFNSMSALILFSSDSEAGRFSNSCIRWAILACILRQEWRIGEGEGETGG